MRFDNSINRAALSGAASSSQQAETAAWTAGGRYQRLPGLILMDPAMADCPLKPATVPDLILAGARALFPVAPRLEAVRLSPDDLRQRRGLPRSVPSRVAGQGTTARSPGNPAQAVGTAPSASPWRSILESRAREAARRRPPESRLRAVAEIWLSVQHALAGHRVAQLMAILILVILAGSFEYSTSGWPKLAAPSLDRPFHAAMVALQEPIRSRAAFFILEDFEGKSEEWLSAGSLRREAGGFLTSAGLALRLDTMELSDYRFDFEARIRSRAVGWVVRASDTRNYYAFKLVESGAGGPHLLRYPVINGSRLTGPVRLDLPTALASAEFNRVTVRVRGEQITTLVNGWGVDFWKDDALPSGGVGFLSENGETALVRKLTITGNDDTWGLILYGTLETLRTLEQHFGSGPLAVRLQPVPRNLMARNN